MTELHPNRPIFLYVHLPKTAGDSLRQHIWDKLIPGKKRIASVPANDLGKNEILARLSDEELLQLDAVMGHGVSASCADFFPDRPRKFFTVLRDPVDMLISQYNWDYREQPIPPEPFESWIKSYQNRICVWFARRFQFGDRQLPDNPTEFFDEALRILEDFEEVGDQLNLSRSLSPVFKQMGIATEVKFQSHVSGNDVKRHIKWTPHIESVVESYCADDIKLYRHFARKAAARR